jgi:hypothetical protein
LEAFNRRLQPSSPIKEDAGYGIPLENEMASLPTVDPAALARTVAQVSDFYAHANINKNKLKDELAASQRAARHFGEQMRQAVLVRS